jgi:SpoVK/Ycf46/Vps4 family AAA+-type ATPase
MNMRQRLAEYVQACFTGIWIESHEHHDAIGEITKLCREQSWHLATWNIASGLSITQQSTTTQDAATDPLSAIRAAGSLASPDGTAILVLENFHRFLQSAEIVQALIQQVASGKQNRVILVILAPVVHIPVELEKLFVVVEHDLPCREELEQIARGIATEEGELPEDAELQSVLDAAAGLTRMEAENAFSLSLVRENRITADAVWELKTQTLKKSGTLTLYQGQDDFSSLGGLAALKTFCKRALLSTSRRNQLHRPRGVMLLSPPGCGKSQFCKALGKEISRPVLQLDVGSLMGSLVGQSEERTRAALKVIDAMAPCIVMLDEIEKAFAGIGSTGDSGVAARMFGTFLSWLNDHESDVFVVCTSNDITKLPPEFSRSERFDGIFFLDLPSREEKDAIWQLYRELYAIDPTQRQPDDTNWTGAEIKSCCRLAALLDVSLTEAAQNVVPVAVTSAESIDRLRTWASGRCLSASVFGIYQHTAGDSKSRRRVNREPSAN